MNNTLTIRGLAALAVILSVTLSGCLGMPDSIRPVTPFQLDNYLGKWYEIARLDHPFERGLSRVTAEYRLRSDGGVSVTNRGYSEKTQKWKQSQGKAYFVNTPDQGYLKVSFFGPFYGSYVIFELDREDYQYAFVSGPDTDYLWLLSRTPTVEADVMQRFIALSQEKGFDTTQIITVQHE